MGNRVIGLYEINVPNVWSIIQANNLFAYCGNNPSTCIDPSGMIGILPDGSIYATEDDMKLDLILLNYKIKYEEASSDKEREEYAHCASVLREAFPGEYTVLASHSIDDYYIPDVTEDFNAFIEENEQDFKNHKMNLFWFALKVKTGSVVDLKNYDAVFNRPSHSYHIILDGEVMRADASGNIAYGYLGTAAQIPKSILLYGAGIYQIYEDSSRNIFNMDFMRLINNYGDNPGDSDQIVIGINRYKNK